MTVLEVEDIKKIYRPRFGGNQVQALSKVTFSVEEGEYVSIMGESGSGKTTLLNIMAHWTVRHRERFIWMEDRYLPLKKRIFQNSEEKILDLYFRTLVCWIHLTSKIISCFRWC